MASSVGNRSRSFVLGQIQPTLATHSIDHWPCDRGCGGALCGWGCSGAGTAAAGLCGRIDLERIVVWQPRQLRGCHFPRGPRAESAISATARCCTACGGWRPVEPGACRALGQNSMALHAPRLSRLRLDRESGCLGHASAPLRRSCSYPFPRRTREEPATRRKTRCRRTCVDH